MRYIFLFLFSLLLYTKYGFSENEEISGLIFGDFSTKAKLTLFVKDAYPQWISPSHKIIFGISPTPTWEVIEKVLGTVQLKKTPLDLQKLGTSRDFGLALRGGYSQVK